jgi:uncharacterized protein (DUF1778 family)
MTDSVDIDIAVDFESDVYDLIKYAADICEQPVSDFVLDAALDKAVRTLLTDKVSFLSPEAYQAVLQTILQAHFNN